MNCKQKIFIIHGRNHAIRKSVSDYIFSLGLDPKIAEDERNEGRTIIEKILDISKDCVFAVAILTKDDLGGYFDNSIHINKIKIAGRIKWVLDALPVHGGSIRLDESPNGKDSFEKFKGAYQIIEELKPRTRQNVIFELGLFIGLKQRKSVAILLEEGIEPFSDFRGVGVIKVDETNNWKEELHRELEHLL